MPKYQHTEEQIYERLMRMGQELRHSKMTDDEVRALAIKQLSREQDKS